MAVGSQTAGRWNQSESQTHSDQSLPRTRYRVSRLSKRQLGEQRSTPPPHHAARRRLSLMGGPFGEQGSILCELTRVGDRTL